MLQKEIGNDLTSTRLSERAEAVWEHSILLPLIDVPTYAIDRLRRYMCVCKEVDGQPSRKERDNPYSSILGIDK